MSRIFVVTRSFQGGATFDSFNRQKFEQGVVAPIRKLLSTAPAELAGFTVVTCGEPGSKFAEEVREGTTPTVVGLRKVFPDETDSDRIVPMVCPNWGLNAGSTTAINAGFELAKERGADRVLIWSPELDLDGRMLAEMLAHQDRHALGVVGYLRSRWYTRIQWKLVQNTCALWDVGLLAELGGFNPDCNGDGRTTVETAEFGAVPLAGMEDFEACLRAYRLMKKFPRWGMVGRSHPAFWNLALKKPGTPEFDNNTKKISRQGLVIEAYIRRLFPDRDPQDVLDDVFAAGFND